MSLIYRNESYDIIGACMEVHKELGSGFLEGVYQEALECELKLRDIKYCREAELSVFYKGNKLCKYYFADFICFDKIILELKAVDELCSDHEAQVINYLKTTGLQLGLLINFGREKLGYKRLVRNITN